MTQPILSQDALKRAAAQEAAKLVPDGAVIGVGTGSTSSSTS
jgi:ribose 5-phosphate isomerase